MKDKLKIIALQNFQNHSQTVLELHPGVNVIIGSSDEGKTAILRCVKWVRKNRPTGTSFIRKGAEHPTRGILQFEDGQASRVKGDKENYYKLSSFEKPFEALGSDVPAEVTSFLNLTDINVQEQFDTFFMLQETSGKVAKRLNEIAGLDEIDDLQTRINKEVKDSNAAVKSLEENIEEKNEQLKQYSDLDSVQVLLIGLSNDIESAERLEDKEKSLTSLLESLQNIDNDLEGYEYLEDLNSKLQELQELQKDIQEQESDEFSLSGLLSELNLIENSIKEITEFLGVEANLAELEIYVKSLQEAHSEAEKLSTLLDELQLISSLELAASQELNKSESSLKTRMEEIGACPLCGSEYK